MPAASTLSRLLPRAGNQRPPPCVLHPDYPRATDEVDMADKQVQCFTLMLLVTLCGWYCSKSGPPSEYC